MPKKTIKDLSKPKTPAKGKELPGEALERVVGGVMASKSETLTTIEYNTCACSTT